MKKKYNTKDIAKTLDAKMEIAKEERKLIWDMINRIENKKIHVQSQILEFIGKIYSISERISLISNEIKELNEFLKKK
jgi:hypothetical protein